MPFKINIGSKGKTWKVELESEDLMGKSIGDKIQGKDIKPELEGYEFEITGGSDFAGFPMYSKVEGIGLRRVLFEKGWGMKDARRGIRKRKTVRGNAISPKIIQINLIVVKPGSKKLEEIFKKEEPAAEGEAPKTEEKPVEAPKEEVKVEEKKEEAKEPEKPEASKDGV